MFGLGFGEMLLIGAIALIAVGPKQLPEVARTLGKFLNEMKRATGEFTKTFSDVSDSTRSAFNETRKSMNDTFAGVTSAYTPPSPHAGDTLADGFEQSPQGSLFVPTDLSHDHGGAAHVPLKSAEEEQLEFRLTSFNDESDRSGKDS